MAPSNYDKINDSREKSHIMRIHDLEAAKHSLLTEKSAFLLCIDDQHTTTRKDSSLSDEKSEETKVLRLDILYDIFLVSVLNLSTSPHHLETRKAILQFSGLFTLMWATWFHTITWRARSSLDGLSATAGAGVFDKAARFGHFWVMIQFAAFSAPTRGLGWGIGSAIAMSKGLLVLQYVQAVWYLRDKDDHGHNRNSMTLMMLIKAKSFALALYLALGLMGIWTMPVWCSVAALEVLMDAAICVGFKVDISAYEDLNKSFRQRLGGLTLIILGGGILAVVKACLELSVQGQLTFDILTMGNTNCFLLIIYFIHTIYFSQPTKSLQSSGRKLEAFWALLHCPLHLALSLSLAVLAPAIFQISHHHKHSVSKQSQLRVAIFALGVVITSLAVMQACSKPSTQLNRRDSARIVMLLLVTTAIINPVTPLVNFVGEGGLELAGWALPAVVLSLASVVVFDKILERWLLGTANAGGRKVDWLSYWKHVGAIDRNIDKQYNA